MLAPKGVQLAEDCQILPLKGHLGPTTPILDLFRPHGTHVMQSPRHSSKFN